MVSGVDRRAVIAAIFLSLVLLGVASADCSIKSIKNCTRMAPKSDDLCGVMGNRVECFQELKPNCSKETWETINEQFAVDGIDLNNRRCDPVHNAYKMCSLDHDIIQAVPKDINKYCSHTEDMWTCTRRFIHRVKSNCHYKPLLDAMSQANDMISSKLDSCERRGYHVTVDYKGAAGMARWSPVVTFVFFLVTTGVLGRQ